MGKSKKVSREMLIISLILSLMFPAFTQAALSQTDSGPIIDSVSPISTMRLQTIVITGSGFGDTPPQTASHWDGSVNTIDGYDTPSMQIRNEAEVGGWTAGFQDSTDRNGIGIILVNWTDTEIVLGGFGEALNGQVGRNLTSGDTIRILVKVSGRMATFLTSVEGSPPDTGNGDAPVISSVSPISTDRLQTITIKGSGFGDIQPELMYLEDGTVNTVGGGDTPVIKIRDDGWKGWGAGVRDSPETGWCIIGIILESWSDTEIVLGGFGTALVTRSQYSFNVGDPMRVTVITSGGKTEYRTTAVAGSEPPPASDEAPIISSVSPISTDRLQTITIKGSGFGDIQPQLMDLGDGSVNTVGGGKDLPGLGNTPVLQVHNEVPGYNYWQAGVRDSPQSGACVIGVILVKWSDTEIVLGGFGAALDSYSRWSLNVGDPMRIVVITSGGKTEYTTTVVAGSDVPPDNYPNSTLPTPDLAISCQCTPTFSDFRAGISGSLTHNGTSLAAAPILLSYSVSGGNSWEELTLVNTDDNGDFLAQWMLFVTGNYLLKAEWNGNVNYSRTVTEISFSVTPSDEQNLISVTSNSTISAFAFNSTSGQLGFRVSGASGTAGQVQVYVPKSLIADVSSLQVFLDNKPLAYNTETKGDSWLVSFTYTHSTHEVTVNLNGNYSTPINGDQWTNYGLIIVLSGIAVALLIFTASKLRQKERKR